MNQQTKITPGIAVLLFAMCVAIPVPAFGQYELERAFAQQFARPVDFRYTPDGSNRIMIVEQNNARIRIMQNLQPAGATTFLSLSDRVHTSGEEEGLLGLALHPNFSDNGYLFVYYTASNPDRGVLSRFTVDSQNSSVADPASELVILEVGQPYTNHNGGSMAFGPDGYLYLGLGDGGSGGDPENYAQTPGSLLGKIVRLDVDVQSANVNYGIPADNPFVGTEGFREEIWAWGFRNPWRMSFDGDGNLWVGDVGQAAAEEIDRVVKGGNYGWRIMEGTLCFEPPSNCNQSGLMLPLLDYPRSDGQSVTGGYVYGGPIVELQGKYIYGDFANGKIWAVDTSGGSPVELIDAPFNVSSFGVDAADELYILGFDGFIYRLKKTSTGTENPGDLNLLVESVFPNPFTEDLSVRLVGETGVEAAVQLVDVLGRPVFETVVNPGSSEVAIRAAALPAGVYVLRVAAGVAVEQRVVVKM